MTNFDHIINWRLQEGSHDFPGPDGGTCINEAAIVAAGFEYRAINSADDCPPCFSRPIATYALNLNDHMHDKVRNELLTPFVTRLAGTSDTREVEQARVEYMVIETVRRILPGVLRLAKLEQQAVVCESVVTFAEARSAAAHAYANANAYAAYAAAYAANAYAAYAAAYAANAYAAYAAYAAAYAANAYAAYATNAANAANAAADAYAAAAADAAHAADAKYEVWLIAVDILDGAIKLGKQGDNLAVEVAVERLNAARKLASVE